MHSGHMTLQCGIEVEHSWAKPTRDPPSVRVCHFHVLGQVLRLKESSLTHAAGHGLCPQVPAAPLAVSPGPERIAAHKAAPRALELDHRGVRVSGVVP